jgi:hypothetical protein
MPLVAFSRKLDDKAFQLSVVGFDQPGIRVEIADAFGRNIFDQMIDHPKAFTKVYRMKNLEVNGLSVRVTDNRGRSRSFIL